jgi:sulfate transport system substrate-binding protein
MTRTRLALPAMIVAALAACTGSTEAPTPEAAAPAASTAATLVLGAYTTPREAFGKAIIPAFTAKWKADKQQDLTVQESYQGSGAQSRAVIGGFEADVVQLSLDPDVDKIAAAGLITHDWRAGEHAGIVTESIVVLAVREGNPKGIKDWADLARADVVVVTPNVKTSGGAMWNVAAIHGAALRGHIAGVAANDPAAAEDFLSKVIQNVKVMDKSGRESLVTFENGVGDVAITYENEVLVARKEGQKMDYVVPSSTILIEMPVAVVDTYATKHGTTELANAFVAYLFTPDAQKAFAEYGYRPVDHTLTPAALPVPADQFTVRDLGGWGELQKALFAKDAAYDRALGKAGGDR